MTSVQKGDGTRREQAGSSWPPPSRSNREPPPVGGGFVLLCLTGCRASRRDQRRRPAQRRSADSRAWPFLPARVGPLPGRTPFTRWRAGSSGNHPSSCGEPSRGWSVRWTVLGRVPRSCDSVTTYLPPVRPRPATRPLAGSWTGSPARATARSRANEQIRISTPLVGPQAAHPV